MRMILQSVMQVLLLWWLVGVVFAVVSFGHPFVDAASSWSLVVDAWKATLQARSS